MEFVGQGDVSFEKSGASAPVRSNSVRSLHSASGFGQQLRQSHRQNFRSARHLAININKSRDLFGSTQGLLSPLSPQPLLQEDEIIESDSQRERTRDILLEELSKEMQQKDERIEELQRQLNEKDQELEQLRTKIHNQKKELKGLFNESQERETSFENYINETRKQFEKHSREVQQQHQADIEKQKKKYQNLEASMETSRAELEEMRRENERLQKKNTKFEQEISQLQNTISALEQVKSAEQQGESIGMKKELDQLKKDCAEYKNRALNLESKLEYQNIHTERMQADFENQINSLNEVIRSLHQKITELQADTDEMDGPVAARKTSNANSSIPSLPGNSLFTELNDVRADDLQRQLEIEKETVNTLKNYVERLLERILLHDPQCLEGMSQSG